MLTEVAKKATAAARHTIAGGDHTAIIMGQMVTMLKTREIVLAAARKNAVVKQNHAAIKKSLAKNLATTLTHVLATTRTAAVVAICIQLRTTTN